MAPLLLETRFNKMCFAHFCSVSDSQFTSASAYPKERTGSLHTVTLFLDLWRVARKIDLPPIAQFVETHVKMILRPKFKDVCQSIYDETHQYCFIPKYAKINYSAYFRKIYNFIVSQDLWLINVMTRNKHVVSITKMSVFPLTRMKQVVTKTDIRACSESCPLCC